MSLTDLVEQLKSLDKEDFNRLVPGLHLARYPAPTTFEAMIYEPLICLFLQGQKQAIAGGQQVTISAGECVLVSHAVPIIARVTAAPGLALVARLDLSELRSLSGEVGEAPGDLRKRGPLSVFPVSQALLGVFSRYAALADDPDGARVLEPLLRRELHYRLLRADSGGMLRQLLHRDSHASSISRAIHILRQDYRQPVEVAELAQSVGMSASSFYKHFKVVTATTPLQYQKDLRLTEARRLLIGGMHTVSTAAYAVGYQSPSQFSREYARKFGAPPRTDRPAG